MNKFVNLSGIAAVLPDGNVDTDKIIPKQYLTTVDRTGLGPGLLHELRYDDEGIERPEFVLNREPFRKASILIAGDNFGCGSSREHAVWALVGFGIQCLIAPSFAAIFRNNCLKNGVLALPLSQPEIDSLVTAMQQTGTFELTVDLLAREIRGPDGLTLTFAIEDAARSRLLEGLDDIELTLKQQGDIASYEKTAKAAFPWLWRAHSH